MVPDALGLEAARALVPTLPIETLAHVVAGPGVFGYDIDYDGVAYFRCPVCQRQDYNRPGARVVDAVRWRCDLTGCRAKGTRWLLERLIIEDPDALERLALLLSEEKAA